MTLFSVDYVFRVKAESVFDEGNPIMIFDLFVLDDTKFCEFFIFENIWRETLLLNRFYRSHLLAVAQAKENLVEPPVIKTAVIKSFGQMPNKVVYREIEELSGITLEKYFEELSDGENKSET